MVGDTTPFEFEAFKTTPSVCPVISYELVQVSADGITESFPTGINPSSPTSSAVADWYRIDLDRVDVAGVYTFQVKATMLGGGTYLNTNVTTISVTEPIPIIIVTNETVIEKNVTNTNVTKTINETNSPVNFAPRPDKSFDVWTLRFNESQDQYDYMSPNITDFENDTIKIEAQGTSSLKYNVSFD